MKTITRFLPSLSLPSAVRPLFSIALLVLATLMLAGCGGSEATPQHAGQHQDEKAAGEHAQHSEGAPRGVAMTPAQAKAIGIRLDTLQAGSATSVLSRPAAVHFDMDRTANVGPRIEGKVRRVTADLGERVEVGETLAIMSSVELGKAKAQYLTAKARLNTQKRAYEREQTLYADSISSEAALLEARAAFEEAQAELKAVHETLRLYGLSEAEVETEQSHGEPLSHFHVTSPIAGTLQQRDAAPGETIGAQETPFHVANPSRMWVMIDAYERDVPVLRTGQRVSLSVRSLPESSFEGTIDFVSQTLDPETRTLRVRAIVDNNRRLLRDGMYGQARIYTDTHVTSALVSTDAVQTIDGQSVVFVPGDEVGHFRAVPVRTGDESQDGMIEIVGGLQPGDVAVTRGAFELKSALTASTRSAAHGH
ncbi:efflux RND transporter periplasmic adaptor subunit [Salisaeta longa]|uniref:efflux RND transporter periplasmic adaptor subunit n=1 Tax=Salisaeta longa TaxID=503170 RepID=UPI0003B6CE13|nr:efflux RND transporter periplasmic adaptor subunit [Salisaeta longa]